jgi:hypothetical protein
MASTLVKDLIDRVQRIADRVDPSYRVRVLDSLDEAQQWYSSQVPWDALKRIEDFQSTGEFLTLPDRVNKIIRIGDRTNARPLNPGEFFEHRRSGAYFQRTTGAPLEWRDMGFVATVKDLSAAAVIHVSSTASEAIAVQVRGLVSDSTASGTSLALYEAKETMSLVGATLASTNTYTTIIAIQKDKGTTNDVLIGTAADGQIARIPSWEARPMYRKVQFSPVPSGQALEVVYFRRPDRITSENDALDPAVNEEALMWRAAGNLHWMDNEGQAAERAWQKANEVIALKRNEEETFGEKDFTVSPWLGYVNLEDEFWQG